MNDKPVPSRLYHHGNQPVAMQPNQKSLSSVLKDDNRVCHAPKPI